MTKDAQPVLSQDSTALTREELERLLVEAQELREENARLRQEAKNVATANVQAAEQMVEMSLRRQRDLEEQNKRIEDALILAEQASTEKTMFLANISHELRTPLNGIIGIAELLLESRETDRHHDQVLMLRRSGESLLAIVNDILDFSKMEVGRLELANEAFDLWQLAEGLVGLLHAGNRKPDLQVQLEIAPDVPRRVLGDELRLRQVLTNLAGNAVKFTEHGHVRVQLSIVDGRMRIVVADTGCGIESSMIDKLFEPFTQVDNSASRKKGGTGLGLAICRRLVRLMGSEIGVRSEFGLGSEFWFDLEIEQAPEVLSEAVPRYELAVLAIRDPQLHDAVAVHLEALGLLIFDGSDLPDDFNSADPAVWVCDEASILTTPLVQRARGIDRVVVYDDRRSIPDAQLAGFRDVRVLQRPFMPTALLSQIAVQRCEVRRQIETLEDVQNRRVLLVEDNAINACVAGTILRKLGCTVDEAVNGVEAVKAVAGSRYDVIFMDCQMPVMDGYEATQRIREMEAGTGYRSYIVALTAHALEDDREHCMQVGMDGYVSKPTSRSALTDILAALDAAIG